MHQLIAIGIILWCVLCVVMAYSACILAGRTDDMAGDELKEKNNDYLR